MEFSQPGFFYAALSLLVIFPLAGVVIFWRRKSDYRAFGFLEAFQNLTAHLSPLRRLLKTILLMSGLFFLTLALAGPQWGSKMVEVRRQGVDVLIALDVSRSMLAEDIKPNRLQRAQQELTALIDQLKGDRVGVLAFAGNAQMACPLTSDFEAAKMFLGYLTPDSITVPGTSLGEAIRLAITMFPKGDEGSRVLVLLTDGEDHHSQPVEAAEAAKAAGIRIVSIGLGTPGGEPIPIRDNSNNVTGYVKDAHGKSVVSRLDEGLLKQITQITGGAFWPSATGSLEAARLSEVIGQMQKRDISAGQYGASEDRFQYALLPGLLCLLAAFWLPQRRRSWLLMVPLLLGLNLTPARADVGSDINQGNRNYTNRRYETALQKYQDAQIKAPDSAVVQHNLGNALHKLNKFEEADAAYRQVLKTKKPQLASQAWYNLGNNFLQQRKFSEAIEPYRRALKINPKDEDALNNLALVLRFLKKPPADTRPKQDQKPSEQKPGQGQNGQGQSQNEKQNSQGQKPGTGQTQKPSGPDDKGEQKSDKKADGDSPDAQGVNPAKAPKPGEMSPEDAVNLLNAVRDSEKEAQQKRLSGAMDKGKKGRENVPEDW
ncbi:MAG: VWA domain-containing protein [Candidatus Firestonebacteria bacterium]|nr:VWA domain-containing protein [Candidatus Firestonebacteria bacterium]